MKCPAPATITVVVLASDYLIIVVALPLLAMFAAIVTAILPELLDITSHSTITVVVAGLVIVGNIVTVAPLVHHHLTLTLTVTLPPAPY